MPEQRKTPYIDGKELAELRKDKEFEKILKRSESDIAKGRVFRWRDINLTPGQVFIR
jgi:hypothetical protein